MKLPRNTLVDTLGKAEGMPPGARKMMKAIYATSPMAQEYCFGPAPVMTLKEFIDSAEKLRRGGWITIETWNEPTPENPDNVMFCMRLSDEALLAMSVPQGTA